MTCIVGMVSDGAVYLGGDSCEATEYVRRTTATKKVWVQGDFVFGVAGSPRIKDLLCYSLEFPRFIETMDVDFYVLHEFMKAWKACLVTNGDLYKRDDQECFAGGFLMGFAGRLFRVGEWFTVQEVQEGYDAIGIGAEVALGSLFTTSQLLWVPGDQIGAALSAAQHHSKDIRDPFEVVVGGHVSA